MNFQKYVFWIVLGLILLAYIGFYILVLSPIVGQNAVLAKQILQQGHKKSRRRYRKGHKPRSKEEQLLNFRDEAIRGVLPNRDLIAYIKKRRAQLQEAYKQCLNFYRKKDLYIDPTETDPNEALIDFRAKYADEKIRLLKKFQNKTHGMRLKRSRSIFGGPFNAADSEKTIHFVDEREIMTVDKKNEAKKKFLLIKEFLNLLENGRVRVLHELSFPDWEPDNDKQLYIWRNVMIKCQIDYEDLPHLLNILLYGIKGKDGIYRAKLLTMIGSLNFEKDIEYKPRTIEIVKISANETDEQAKQRYWAKHAGETTLPAVMVEINCLVLDFRNPKQESDNQKKKK